MPIAPFGICRQAQALGAKSVCTGWNNEFGAHTLFWTSVALTDFTAEIARCRDAGIEVSSGIANQPHDISRLIAYGVDALWTDDVEAALAAVRRGG